MKSKNPGKAHHDNQIGRDRYKTERFGNDEEHETTNEKPAVSHDGSISARFQATKRSLFGDTTTRFT